MEKQEYYRNTGFQKKLSTQIENNVWSKSYERLKLNLDEICQSH